MYKLKEDGITHINIHPKGKTILGRSLDYSAFVPFTHPVYGKFNTLNALWVHLNKIKTNDFKKDLALGIIAKIESNSELKTLFINSTLPFTNYYFSNNKICKRKMAKWLTTILTEYRNKCNYDRGNLLHE